MTPAGIEPATFRFVAQHLNHCATAGQWVWYVFYLTWGRKHRNLLTVSFLTKGKATIELSNIGVRSARRKAGHGTAMEATENKQRKKSTRESQLYLRRATQRLGRTKRKITEKGGTWQKEKFRHLIHGREVKKKKKNLPGQCERWR